MIGRADASSTRARRSPLIALGALAAIVFAWTGCTVSEQNYAWLSFWFDGVPDPNAPLLPGATAAEMRQSATYSIHEPFAQERCDDCHRGGTRFSPGAVNSATCLECHGDVPAEQPLMHGPVAAVACLWCHTGHESPYTALLKGPPRQVCATCHDAALLSAARVPEHAPESDVSCLDCHSGHGGTTRYFLHSAGAPSRPAQSEPQP